MCNYSDAILDQGIEIGESRGVINTLASLVRDQILTVAEAAKRAGMDAEEFRKKAGLISDGI